MAPKLAIWTVLTAQALALVACDDLSEFKTGRGTVFRGEVVGSDSAPDQSSFIRKGFSSHTHMDLEFDPYSPGLQVDGDDDAPASPGRVHTYSCPVREPNCDAADGTPGPFDRARLEPIENLAHDSLSEYTFPGGGRLRNYLFSVRFASTPEGGAAIQRNAMVFLSLMDSGRIEVRAISPSVLASDGRSEQVPALFGVFVLDRQSK